MSNYEDDHLSVEAETGFRAIEDMLAEIAEPYTEPDNPDYESALEDYGKGWTDVVLRVEARGVRVRPNLDMSAEDSWAELIRARHNLNRRIEKDYERIFVDPGSVDSVTVQAQLFDVYSEDQNLAALSDKHHLARKIAEATAYAESSSYALAFGEIMTSEHVDELEREVFLEVCRESLTEQGVVVSEDQIAEQVKALEDRNQENAEIYALRDADNFRIRRLLVDTLGCPDSYNLMQHDDWEGFCNAICSRQDQINTGVAVDRARAEVDPVYLETVIDSFAPAIRNRANRMGIAPILLDAVMHLIDPDLWVSESPEEQA